MKDLISRQAAIDAIYEHEFSNWCDKDEVSTILNDLPPAEPKWVSCSERLPENGKYYLWCSNLGRIETDYYWDGFKKGQKYGYNIVAWMPLPEKYRGESE